MTKLSSYKVTIESKAAAGQAAEQKQFLFEAADYKGAWVGARSLCRLGGKATFVTDSGNEEGDLAAGQFTVRKIFTTETRSKKEKVLTADALISAAQEANVKIPQKLLDLLGELKGPQTETNAEAA